MRRSLWSRALAGMLAMRLAFVLSAPLQWNACPAHDGLSVGHAVGPSASHAAHMEHAIASHARHDDASSGGRGPVCTCTDHCCCAPVSALRAQAAALSPTRLSTVASSAFRAAQHVPAAADHLRPFAIGPPSPQTA